MVALPPGDHVMSLGFADLEVILPRQFQRSFHCFGSTGNEVDPLQPLGRKFHQFVSQSFGRGRGEKTGMGEGHIIKLRLDRRCHMRIAMPQTGNSGVPAVQISLTVLVKKISSRPAGHYRRWGF